MLRILGPDQSEAFSPPIHADKSAAMLTIVAALTGLEFPSLGLYTFFLHYDDNSDEYLCAIDVVESMSLHGVYV